MVWSRAIRGSSHSRAVSHIDVEHAGDVYRVKLRSTRTVRRLTLRVSHSSGDVVLTTPHRLALSDAIDFAQRHAAWIGARLRRLPDPIPFAPGEIIPIRGVDHRIVHAPARRGTVWTELLQASEEAPPIATLCVAGETPHLSRRVTDYLKRTAKQDLEASVERYCHILKIPARSVTVRDTTSRWGSCSASGSLNFSWRLIFAPAFVLDYLAAHEVAHLIHMNHSKKFWALTRKLCEDTDRAEAWLNAQGPTLYRYGKSRDGS
jgi:predicted metal-dependent hydrolase